MSVLLQPQGATDQFATAADRSAVRSVLPGGLLALDAACTMGFFLPRAFSPWHWFYDENGALYGLMGCNYFRTGLAATRGGAQHWTTFDGPVARPEFYSTHPPLLPWLCGAAQWLLGVRPFAVRLVPTLGQILSLIPLFLLGRRLFGAVAAAWGTLIYALLPMTAYFGFAVCYESLNNMFILSSVYCYVRINDEGNSPGKACMFGASLFAGMWTDWPAYFVAMGIGLDWFLTRRGWQRMNAAVPWATGLVSFALFVAFIFQLGGTGSGGLGSLINAFRNRTGISPDENYSILQFGSFLASENAQLYGVGVIFLIGGLCAMRGPRVFRPMLVLLATAALHVLLFSYGAMTHEYWTFYFVGPVALGAMACFARWSNRTRIVPLYVVAGFVLAVQSAWVIADYDSPYYCEWSQAHIRMGQKIAQHARADEVVMMTFGWGDGAIVAYYAQRPMVRVNSTEELQRIRSHPDFHGGFVVLSENFTQSAGDGEEFLQSLECIDEQVSFGDRIRILHVLPASQPADQTEQAPSS